MGTRTMLCAFPLALVLATILSAGQQPARPGGAAWRQWGGPARNFMSDAKGLASKWPATGPKKLWSRALGEGHSAIAAEGGRLYTMYRPLGPGGPGGRSQEEVIAALDAGTGTTIWEHRYPSPTSGINFSEGAGPHSTPLVTADRVFAVILDEDGTLGLATVTPDGLQVLAKAPVLENRAWTPPTLVGTRLYARDRKNIAAFELGPQ